MKRSQPRPFGLELLRDVTPYVAAAALSAAVVAAGCSPNGNNNNSSGSSVAPGSTAPVPSTVTMAYSMPSAQFPSGDTQ